MGNNLLILLWLSGAATALSLAAVAGMALRNSRLRERLAASERDTAGMRTRLMRTEEIIKGSARLAVWHWGGWHHPKDPSKKWAIAVRMRVVESSLSKEGLHRFEFISHTSPESSDTWATTRYQEYFYKNYDGGWLDTNGLPGFHWTTEMDAQTSRALKLDSLGITTDTETPTA